jgi:hypothetical protein
MSIEQGYPGMDLKPGLQFAPRKKNGPDGPFFLQFGLAQGLAASSSSGSGGKRSSRETPSIKAAALAT